MRYSNLLIYYLTTYEIIQSIIIEVPIKLNYLVQQSNLYWFCIIHEHEYMYAEFGGLLDAMPSRVPQIR